MIEKLAGSKTYLALAAYAIFEVVAGAGALAGVDPAIVQAIRGVLLAASGAALRAGVQKAENASRSA